MAMQPARDGIVHHLTTSLSFTAVTVVIFGIVYPLVMTGAAQVAFPGSAAGSLVTVDGKIVASKIVGQRWTRPQYFAGRPSAAGKGYDPTATGGTNLGPTSKKLIDMTRATIVALRKANPDATLPIPMDLVTSSGSGIDPDISPAAAYYQVPRVAKARDLTNRTVTMIVDRFVQGRTLGFLGEPHVNVLDLNLALDRAK